MSINALLYSHPAVKPALDRAYAIINTWREGLNGEAREGADVATLAWDGVALGEAIAEAILEEQGISDEDLELFDELYGEFCCEGINDSALFEMWESERKRQSEET